MFGCGSQRFFKIFRLCSTCRTGVFLWPNARTHRCMPNAEFLDICRSRGDIGFLKDGPCVWCRRKVYVIYNNLHIFDISSTYKYYDIFTYACDTCEWSYLMCFICIIICMAVLYSWIYSWVSQTNSNSHSGISAVIATLPTAVIPQFPRQNGHGVNPNSVQCDEVAGCRGLWVWVRFVVDCWEQATLGTWRFVRWYWN